MIPSLFNEWTKLYYRRVKSKLNKSPNEDKLVWPEDLRNMLCNFEDKQLSSKQRMVKVSDREWKKRLLYWERACLSRWMQKGGVN